MKYSRLICHRLPERSFHLRNHQFPVCARCTGFYTGLAIFLIYNFLFPINYTLTVLIISIFLLIPTSIDGLTQYMGLRESNNNLRFITGLIGGFGLIILFKIIFKIIYEVFL